MFISCFCLGVACNVIYLISDFREITTQRNILSSCLPLRYYIQAEHCTRGDFLLSPRETVSLQSPEAEGVIVTKEASSFFQLWSLSSATGVRWDMVT